MIVERETLVAGIPIRWAEAGEGDAPPFLLLHGLGSDHAKWLDAMPHLAAHRRAIALDLPGFGRSGAPDASYAPSWVAGGVRAFCDAIGVERAIVVGNSFGGLVATYFAAAWPERCEAAVLVAPVLPNDGPQPSAKIALGFLATALPGVGSVLTRSYWRRPPERIVAESLARNTVDPARVSPETRARLLADAQRKAASPPLLRAAYRSTRQTMWAVTGRRETTWATLRSVRVPTLLLWGAEDRVLPAHIGHRAVERLPGSHLIVIDDCGHNPQMEKPEEFARAVGAFVRALDARVG